MKKNDFRFREDLREEKATEMRRLTDHIADLNDQKTSLREEMLNLENQLEEKFFQEMTVLKSNFNGARVELEQRIDEGQVALQNMTHERDMHIQVPLKVRPISPIVNNITPPSGCRGYEIVHLVIVGRLLTLATM